MTDKTIIDRAMIDGSLTFRHSAATRRIAVCGLLFGLVVAAFPPTESAAQHQHHGATSEAPLYTTLGNHQRSITTSVPEAQAYFDQGLRLEYAFNHAEAIRSYEAALAHDDACAMCWWGIALAYGPNINAGTDDESARKAFEAIARASVLASDVTEVERDLIAALAKRYDEDPAADRAALDAAYADAMALVAAAHPNDADVLTLYAAALMNRNPWDYWAGRYDERTPNPGTVELVGSLERAMELDRLNPGACHYYIHAVEAAYPERAVECAERLAALMPGAGHIVHMPGHIYIRVGRYRDAVTANDHAVHSDETYIADQRPTGLYPAAYYPHNYHFMAFAATLAGMRDKATFASDAVAPKVSVDIALIAVFIQSAAILPHLTAVTFGEWEKVLALPMPDPRLELGVVVARYARGTAHAALGDPDAAAEEARLLHEVATAFDPDGENPVAQIARLSLSGEIALRSGDADAAVDAFAEAAEIEDAMLYEEPPLWYYPVRHSLGKALLAAGRPADAEVEYRYDLARFPDNGWSLFGLAQALEQQGRTAEAADVRAQFANAWRYADVELTSSRY